jgi:hypothetical protein
MLKIIKRILIAISIFSMTLVSSAPSGALAQANPNAGVEAQVRAAMADLPEMIVIAKCESGFRQFAPDGTPLRGGTGKKYVGIFQIDENLHRQKALDMVYDINTVVGNVAYARYLHSKSGTNPWKGCLGTPVAPAPAPGTPAVQGSGTGSLASNLNFGMTNAQVLTLQQILNKSGFVISASGPGSPGNETSYFGAMTREAVRKFQCAKNITCSGSESTTGYGMVGPRTRAALNSM